MLSETFVRVVALAALVANVHAQAIYNPKVNPFYADGSAHRQVMGTKNAHYDAQRAAGAYNSSALKAIGYTACVNGAFCILINLSTTSLTTRSALQASQLDSNAATSTSTTSSPTLSSVALPVKEAVLGDGPKTAATLPLSLKRMVLPSPRSLPRVSSTTWDVSPTPPDLPRLFGEVSFLIRVYSVIQGKLTSTCRTPGLERPCDHRLRSTQPPYSDL